MSYRHSAETRARMSSSHKGTHPSVETRAKMSKALLGNKRFLGKRHTDELKKKMSILKSGRKVSEETLKRMSLSSPKVWLGKKFSEEHRQKISLSSLGKKMSVEAVNKMRISKTGENHWRWYKDRTKLKMQEDRRSSAVGEWRKSVYKRDGFKCKIKNESCNGRIEAHHILNWEDFPELRYIVDNGITLCHFHHPRGRKKEEELSLLLQELVLK